MPHNKPNKLAGYLIAIIVILVLVVLAVVAVVIRHVSSKSGGDRRTSLRIDDEETRYEAMDDCLVLNKKKRKHL